MEPVRAFARVFTPKVAIRYHLPVRTFARVFTPKVTIRQREIMDAKITSGLLERVHVFH
jgi:hypothetical protein